MSLHLVTGYAGREHVTSADHGSFNIAFVGAGEYVFDRGQKFTASIIDNNTVDVADGDILMQGRHIRQIENHVTRLTFENGERGFYRNDLIVAEYRKDPETFVESATLKVLKGTQTDNAENVTDPEYTHGDITEATGAMLNQMPLYRVKFTGYEISNVEQLFEWLPSVQHILDKMWEDIGEIPTEAEEYFEREKARFTSEINAAEAQFLENLDSTEVSNQQAFQTWFDTIKGIFDGDVAGHLQNEIDQLNTSKAKKTDITNISITGTTNNTGSTIFADTLFYLNGTLCKALVNVDDGAIFTKDTNYARFYINNFIKHVISVQTNDLTLPTNYTDVCNVMIPPHSYYAINGFNYASTGRVTGIYIDYNGNTSSQVGALAIREDANGVSAVSYCGYNSNNYHIALHLVAKGDPNTIVNAGLNGWYEYVGTY